MSLSWQICSYLIIKQLFFWSRENYLSSPPWIWMDPPFRLIHQWVGHWWCIHHWLPTIFLQQLISSLIVVQTQLSTPLSISLSDLWAFWCCQFFLIVCNAAECPPTCLQSAGQTHCLSRLVCVSVCELMLADIKLQVQPQSNAAGDRFLNVESLWLHSAHFRGDSGIFICGEQFEYGFMGLFLWTIHHGASHFQKYIRRNIPCYLPLLTPTTLPSSIDSNIRGKNAYDTCWWIQQETSHTLCQSLEK